MFCNEIRCFGSFTFRDLEDLFQDYERSVNEVAKKKNESGKLVVLHDKLVSEIQYKVNTCKYNMAYTMN